MLNFLKIILGRYVRQWKRENERNKKRNSETQSKKKQKERKTQKRLFLWQFQFSGIVVILWLLRASEDRSLLVYGFSALGFVYLHFSTEEFSLGMFLGPLTAHAHTVQVEHLRPFGVLWVCQFRVWCGYQQNSLSNGHFLMMQPDASMRWSSKCDE